MTNKKYLGFTLIEILIVVFIIGLVSTTIVLRANRNNYKQVVSFAELMKSQLELARQQSIIQMRIIGFYYDQQQYEFYQYEEKPKPDWLALKNRDSFWQSSTVPLNLEFSIETSLKLKSTKKDEEGPTVVLQIIFYPSGELSAFTITIRNPKIARPVTIIGKASGEINVVEKS